MPQRLAQQKRAGEGQAQARQGRAQQKWAGEGQATVELALLMPFLVLLLMCIVQTALVARDAVLVSHAARVGARIASVDPSLDGIRGAVTEATPLDPARLKVEREAAGDLVRVTVHYRSPTEVPLVGALVGDVAMTESAAMPVE